MFVGQEASLPASARWSDHIPDSAIPDRSPLHNLHSDHLLPHPSKQGSVRSYRVHPEKPGFYSIDGLFLCYTRDKDRLTFKSNLLLNHLQGCSVAVTHVTPPGYVQIFHNQMLFS